MLRNHTNCTLWPLSNGFTFSWKSIDTFWELYFQRAEGETEQILFSFKLSWRMLNWHNVPPPQGISCVRLDRFNIILKNSEDLWKTLLQISCDSFDSSESDSASWEISEVTLKDEGYYECIAINSAGTGRARTYLDVSGMHMLQDSHTYIYTPLIPLKS